MRIAVIGATGMAGSAIVTEALSRGHQVAAISRSPQPKPDHDRLTSWAIDVADTTALDPVLAAVDAVVVTIRLAPGEEDRLAPLTRGVLDTAERRSTRVLIIGGSAPLRSPSRPDRLVIDDPDHVPDAWKPIARASLEQFRICQEHSGNAWVYVSPPAVLEPGARTGRYRRGSTTLLTDEDGDSRIVAPDLAIAVLDEVENPCGEQHFTVAAEPVNRNPPTH